MAVSAKTRAKRHAAVKKGWRASVPKFNIMDYKVSMMKTLAHFAAEVDNKEKQELVISYWKKIGKNVTGFSKLSDGWFAQAAVLVYLIEDEVTLEDSDLKYLENKYHELLLKVKPDIEAVVKKEKAPKVNTDQDKANSIGAIIDGELSKAFDAKGKYEFNVKDFLIKNAVSSSVAKIVATFYKNQLDELALVPKDPQCEESYAWLGKVGLKRMIDFVSNIIESCLTVSQIAKTTRKPRVKKEKPATVLAAKMKYLKEYTDLKLKSVTPDKIVGSDEVWLFNIKYRKLFRYVALDGMKLSVKGSTIMNFDPEKSGAKTIRKPEAFMPNIIDQTKRIWIKNFNDVKSVMAKATGRVNEEVIIVKVF